MNQPCEKITNGRICLCLLCSSNEITTSGYPLLHPQHCICKVCITAYSQHLHGPPRCYQHFEPVQIDSTGFNKTSPNDLTRQTRLRLKRRKRRKIAGCLVVLIHIAIRKTCLNLSMHQFTEHKSWIFNCCVLFFLLHHRFRFGVGKIE